MKLLFIHDNRFWKLDDKVYSYGHFAYELLWKRYLTVFDEIRVGGRFQEVQTGDKINHLSLSSGPNVSFFALPDLMSMRGLFQIRKARRILESEIKNAEALIIRLPSNLGYLACHIAKQLHKKYLIEVVGCTWDDLWNYGSLTGRIAAIPSLLFEKVCVRHAPAVLYVSRRFLQKRYPCRNLTTSCPDTNLPETPLEVLARRLEYIRTMNERPVIRLGLIASLNVGYKGHDTAIRALALLAPRYKHLQLVFLGDGSPDKWKRLAEQEGVVEHVEFQGSLPGGKPVLDWLDNLDIFLMPSLQETLGRALVEAMSRGCPAIGGAGTAVPEQLPDDCIHARKNAAELAALIQRMLEEPYYMELCAIENFHCARKYSETLLAPHRQKFWKEVFF